MSLGFVNQVSNNPKATRESMETIRNVYEDSPIFFSVDGNCSDYYRNAFHMWDHQTEWLINDKKLGYPPYEKEQVLEWLKRMYIGVLKLNTDHFMMLEDDVVILNQIQYDNDVECLGHNITHGNEIPYFILEEIERISKVKPLTSFYGNGGGSIFKSKTFIENYHKITKYINQWWYLYKLHFYPQAGYMDCYMTLYYMLCGKSYTPNERMYNLDPHSDVDVEIIKAYSVDAIRDKYCVDYDIVHGVKSYYGA